MEPSTGNLNDRVLSAIQNDPRTSKDIIEVASMQGIVTISGTVKKDSIRQAAEEIARSQPGVLAVVNEIKVSR